MDIEHLLTATRSARKSLDLDAPVDLADIRECLRIGLQAANGSNQQSWRWLVIADPALRERIAALYREAYLLRVGGQMLAHLLPPDTPEARLMSSTEWLVENMAKVPLLVIPCYEPYMPRIDGDESFYRATLYGSIFPAVWNFQLALHTRGMDRLDRELLRSAYHDDAIDDHVGFVGPVDEFIDWAFTYHAAQTRHQHYLTNHTAEVNPRRGARRDLLHLRRNQKRPGKAADDRRRSLHRPPPAQGRPLGHRGAGLPHRVANRVHFAADTGGSRVPRPDPNRRSRSHRHVIRAAPRHQPGGLQPGLSGFAARLTADSPVELPARRRRSGNVKTNIGSHGQESGAVEVSWKHPRPQPRWILHA